MANSRNSPSPDSLPEHLARVIIAAGLQGRRLCVGLSGGVDSVALLLALHACRAELGGALSACHVHHGLSPHADQWLGFCEFLCESLGVAFSWSRVGVSADTGKGLEAAARAARYHVLHAVEADALLLGHHQGDQAETLLHRMFRGAGVRGCAAMSPDQTVGRAGAAPLRVLRPLLGFPKVALVSFVRAFRAGWVTDDSNADTRFTRNFLRLEILPRLRERYPAIEATLARNAQHFAEAQSLLADLARLDLASARDAEGLSVEVLGKLGPPRVRNLLRYLLARFEVMPPDHDRLCELARQLFEATPDRELEWDLDAFRLARCGGRVYCLAAEPRLPQPLRWAGQAQLDWAGGRLDFIETRGQGVPLDWIYARGLDIRPRAGGEQMALAANRPRRSLKHLFQASGVPAWLRAITPIVWCGDDLAGVGGLGMNPQLGGAPDGPTLVVRWQPPKLVLPLPD